MFTRIPHTRLILVIETTESSLPLVEAIARYIRTIEPRVKINVKTYRKLSGLAADFVNETKPREVYVVHSDVPEALKPLIRRDIWVEMP